MPSRDLRASSSLRVAVTWLMWLSFPPPAVGRGCLIWSLSPWKPDRLKSGCVRRGGQMETTPGDVTDRITAAVIIAMAAWLAMVFYADAHPGHAGGDAAASQGIAGEPASGDARQQDERPETTSSGNCELPLLVTCQLMRPLSRGSQDDRLRAGAGGQHREGGPLQVRADQLTFTPPPRGFHRRRIPCQ
jgi:hypothetical protein